MIFMRGVSVLRSETRLKGFIELVVEHMLVKSSSILKFPRFC